MLGVTDYMFMYYGVSLKFSVKDRTIQSHSMNRIRHLKSMNRSMSLFLMEYLLCTDSLFLALYVLFRFFLRKYTYSYI
jgi:hypothetical protein